ncbi:hypothetical protein AB0G15_26910 [Streptosporangium sp. NPDC023825]|uniref:hypothetical protein n=1 Tax=Streptosporangium sp. NPDC023825 TaxID=3154909 RepID=UPI003416C72C
MLRPAAGRFDEVTLGFYDEYAATLKGGRKTSAPKAAPARATSGDMQAALEEVLAAADRPLWGAAVTGGAAWPLASVS